MGTHVLEPLSQSLDVLGALAPAVLDRLVLALKGDIAISLPLDILELLLEDLLQQPRALGA